MLGLPSELLLAYQHVGIKDLYTWQSSCLENSGVLKGHNLIYCAPTSGGKSLVADLAILHTVIVSHRKVLIVMPYVSLVIEKELSLKKLLTYLNRSRLRKDRLKVASYYGEKALSRRFKESIIVCTIEKANAVVNSFIGNRKVGFLGSVVFDEMHVLGNTFNGYLLEILIR